MLDDLRFGFRRVLRAPASSLAIVAILAAGIGATGAMVSVLDALVYRPLNLPNPDALVSIPARDARQLPRLMPLITIDHLHASDMPVDGLVRAEPDHRADRAGRRTGLGGPPHRGLLPRVRRRAAAGRGGVHR